MKYTLLFRGINVGGKNVVKMNDLKQLFLELGLNKVKTYIQSGNVVLESNLEEACLQDTIQIAFTKRFGFESKVMIRSIEEIQDLIDGFPIPEEKLAAAEAANSQVEHIYVYFLNQLTEQAQIDAILKEYEGSDMFWTRERELYLLCHDSVSRSKLAIRMGKVFNSATVRNWKTVNKLYEMLNEL